MYVKHTVVSVQGTRETDFANQGKDKFVYEFETDLCLEDEPLEFAKVKPSIEDVPGEAEQSGRPKARSNGRWICFL